MGGAVLLIAADSPPSSTSMDGAAVALIRREIRGRVREQRKCADDDEQLAE